MRKPVLIFGLIVAALLLAACRAEVNISLDVAEDGSGSVAFELGTDQEFRDLMGSSGADADDLFGDIESGVEGGEVFEREDGDMSYQGVRVDFDNIDEVSDTLTDVGSDFFGGFGTFSFEIDESSAVFDATLTADEQDLGQDIPFDPSQLSGDFFSAGFVLSMPGTVTSHNADEVLADGSLRWELPLLGGTTELHAESEFGGSGFPWLFVIIALVVVIGIAALVGAITMSSRKEKQAVSAAAVASQDAPTPEADLPDPDTDLTANE